MICKISKLRNFGVFYNFTWKTELPNFKKFNLIYGWNRSGKTTISRVFSCCEKKTTNFKQYPENSEFELITDDGKIFKCKDVATNVLPIKVFNKDFIDENLFFESSNLCNPIIYVSEEDIESKKRLENLKREKISLNEKYEQAKKDKLSKEETKNTFLTGLGREIANILPDKTYNKTKVENKINSIGVDNFSDKILSDEEKKQCEEIIKNDAKNSLTPLLEFLFSFTFDEGVIDSFQKIYEKAGKLLSKKIVSETLDRLKDDQSLNNWVKQGFDLLKTRNEQEKCLFCQKPLDKNFLNTLSRHFSKDYEDLQSAITLLKNEVLGIKKSEIPSKNDDLYLILKDKYTNEAQELNRCIKKVNEWIDELATALQEKYNDPFAVVSGPRKPENFLTSYNNTIEKLNKIIDEHNKKVEDHASEFLKARDKLELHTIAPALTEQDYGKMESDLKVAKEKEKEALEKFKNNNFEIKELEKQTSNIGKAIKEINNHLKEFFGREEIKLELDENKKGYKIIRDGQPAKNLSEGEKTAIAFSYFIVKVGERDFDKSKGIIFIDDPISSFDSNFIYHCFSIINTRFNDVGQLFISTHNFQFFNLVKDWFVRHNKDRKSKGKDECCEFFMIENFTESNHRQAKIGKLDKTLRNYKSEYHFLFTKLREFSEKQDTEYEDFYTIGNMARRFFDIFVDFKIPTTGDQKSKMDILIKNINEPGEKISPVDANKVYKLVNELSHNSDPTSIIEHKDKSECKEAIKILLNIVKESDPKHFKILEKN